jgi:DNA polymerase-3 subunit gamma/tau
VNAFLEGNVPQAMLIFNEILTKGFDAGHFVSGLCSHLRDVLVCKDSQTVALLEVGAAIGESYKSQATQCEVDFLYQALKIANECDLEYRQSKNKRLLVEIMLIRLSQLSDKKKNELIEESSFRLQPVFSNLTQTISEKSSVEVPTPVISQPTIVQPKPVSTASASIPGLKSISISKPLVHKGEVEQAQTHAQNRKTEFSQENLISFWFEFTKTITDHIHLANTMHANLPVLKEDFLFEIQVENSFQEKELFEIQADLIAFLSDKLQNDFITMKITVDETREVKKVMLAKDKFDYLAEKNENFKKMVSDLGLEIV